MAKKLSENKNHKLVQYKNGQVASYNKIAGKWKAANKPSRKK